MVDEVFAEAVRAAVAERTEGEVLIERVQKNNGLTLTGITVRNEGSMVSPNIYLDNIPDEKRSDENVNIIADEIIRTLDRHRNEGIENTVEELRSMLADKELLLNSLMPRVVNYEWNKELLEGLPHRRYLDLAITYEIEINSGSTCRVRNGMGIEISEEEMYEAAMRNARLRKYAVTSISDMLERCLCRSGFIPADVESARAVPMIVITNESMSKGAYGIADTQLLADISEGFRGGDGSGADLIIIPSSTNEILALPIRDNSDLDAELETLRWMVSEVNKSSVPEEERLSDSVYIFNRETKELRIA